MSKNTARDKPHLFARRRNKSNICFDVMDQIAFEDAFVHQRIERLNVLPLSDLASLSESKNENVVLGDHNYVLSIFHKTSVPGEHLIAAVLFESKFFGMAGRMRADGFVVNSRNERRARRNDEYYKLGL